MSDLPLESKIGGGVGSGQSTTFVTATWTGTGSLRLSTGSSSLNTRLPSPSAGSINPSTGLPSLSFGSIGPTIRSSSSSTDSPCSACYGVVAVTRVTKASDFEDRTKIGEYTWDVAYPFATNSESGLSAESISQSSLVAAPSQTMYNIFASPRFGALVKTSGVCTSTLYTGVSDTTPWSIMILTGVSDGFLPEAESSFLLEFPQMTCSTEPDGQVAFVSMAMASTATNSANTTPMVSTSTFAASTTAHSNLTAELAIGIGAGIGGALICVIVIFLILRFRAQKVRMSIRPDPMTELSA